MAISSSRLAIILQQQTAVSQKVYAAVPIAEYWTTRQIVQELNRTGGPRELKLIEGCLDSLKESGLIKEASPGNWIRASVRIKEETNVTKTAFPTLDTKSQVQEAKTGSSLPDQIAQTAKKLRDLADHFDNLALSVDEELERLSTPDEEMEKLRALQRALKGLV